MSYLGHDSFILTSHSPNIVVCIRTHFYSHVGRDSFICWTWLIHTWDMTHLRHQLWPEYHGVYTHALLLARGTWLIYIWDMTHCLLPAIARIIILWSRPSIQTHSYVGHDSFIRGTRLIHMWDMTHCLLPAIARTSSSVFSFIYGTWLLLYGTWLLHIRDMTPSYVGHDSFICGTWLIASYQP